MKITKKTLGTMGAATLTTGILAAGGIAGASPMYGADSSSSMHHSDMSSMQNDSMSKEARYYSNNGWNNWSPDNYKASHGGDFSQWWNDMNDQVGEYGSMDWDNSNTKGHDQNWTPSGDGWQSDWNNWNPEMWWNNGSSYDNWRNHIMQYMSQSKQSIQISYTASVSFSAMVDSSNQYSSYDSGRGDY